VTVLLKAWSMPNPVHVGNRLTLFTPSPGWQRCPAWPASWWQGKPHLSRAH